MNTKTEIDRHKLFEKIWTENLEPALVGLQEEKHKAKKMKITYFSIGFVLFATIIALQTLAKDFLTIAIIICLSSLVLLLLRRLIKNNKNTYNIQYKEKIFGKILNHTELKWSYLHRGDHIFSFKLRDMGRVKDDAQYSTSFRESGLYSGYTYVIPDDVFSVMWNSSKIVMSEMRVIKETTSSKGERHIETVFNGFFIDINLVKSFDGETYVLTNNDWGYVAGGYDVPFSDRRIEEVDLEWNDFEKFLRVRASNQREAREIFTPDFMAMLHDWWNVHKKDLRFSFKGSHIYITIPSKLDFEPSIFRSNEKEKQYIQEHLELLWFIEEIIRMLILKNNLIKI